MNGEIAMKHSCRNCGVKERCLKRSYLLFMLYIVTGHMNELTEEVRENFSGEENCEHWLAATPAAPV